MTSGERKRIVEGYDQVLARIRAWIWISATAVSVGLVAWKALVPVLSGDIGYWANVVVVTNVGLAGSWLFCSLILLASYRHEKKARLRKADEARGEIR